MHWSRSEFAWLAMAATASPAQDRFAARREQMVRLQMEGRAVRDPAVLKAMRGVPRHLFVPSSAQDAAYEDQPLPIGYGQTISQAFIVASMTELLEIGGKQRVLEIGTGSGYQAAVLSLLAAEVFSIEIVPELAASSAALLRRLGYANVAVRQGDGYLGWPEKAPFDRIILTAAPPKLPQALVDQLKPGGKLVAPVGGTPFNQELVVVDKTAAGQVRTRSVFGVRFVPMVPGKN